MMPSPRIQTVPVSSGGIANGAWTISVIDRLKYEQLFESLKPMNGMLAGTKVRGVLMESKLPMDTLGKIWDLADQDKDGNLDKHEFVAAMHLVYQTLDKRTVPDVLPQELRKPAVGSAAGPPPKPAPPMAAVNATMPRAPSGEGFGDGGFVANFPQDIGPPPAIPPLPIAMQPPMQRVPPVGGSAQPLIQTDPLIPIGAPPSVIANADWVVTADELKRFEIMFRDSDRDKDGLVSGIEVKNVFLQSGVPQKFLALIWALCDTNQSGKLTLEQFALAMWMVERKQKGIEPPQVLTANMVPPSMRGIVSGVDLQPQVEPKPTYSNPELEMISKEIEELAKERRSLETEISQKEADIRIKTGEVRSLQSELDTLSATLKQLENQRGEAQKRLDDLKAQVTKIREQCQKQEDTINEQEGELNAKRSELQKLKDEEAALQKEYDGNNRELQKLTNHLQNTQLQISSVRSMVTHMMETQRQMTDALLMCRAAIDSQNADLVTEYQLKIEPDFDDALKTLEKKIEEPKADPFEDNSLTNATKATNGFASNGFENDPFAGSAVSTTVRSGFDDSFSTSTGFDSGFDAFGSSNAFTEQKDPFGGDAFSGKSMAVTPEPGKDDFGSDPFAALHAPTGQGQILSPNTQKSGPPPRPEESPSPALPPKKSKVPPPRPAPPRPAQGPARPTQPTMDAFGSTTTSGGFADFADFDNKTIPQPLPTQMTQTLSGNLLFDTNIKLSSLSSSISPLPLTSTTTSAGISTTSSTNNNLLRSTTPRQQAANVMCDTTLSTLNNNNNNSKVRGPTDFSDDPFKDYRYEDPFNIKDPFADNETDFDVEKVFKDDVNLEDDKNNGNSKDGKDSTKSVSPMASQNFHSKTFTEIRNEVLDQFNTLNINPSPVPSQKSTSSSINIGSTNAFSTNTSHATSVTPVPAIGGGSELFDNFGDFDAFSTKSSSTVESVKSINRSNKNDKNNDSFFDAFNDNFNSNSKVDDKNKTSFSDAFGNSGGNIKSLDSFGSMTNTINNNAFDAFKAPILTGTGTTTKSPKPFNDNFEDDFFNTNIEFAKDQNTNFNINTESTIKNSMNNDFAKFDAFGDDNSNFNANVKTALNNSINLSNEKIAEIASTITAKTVIPTAAIGKDKLIRVKNPMTLNKKTPNTENNIKAPEKFAADYSQPESYDTDLQEALKRSMVEN